MLHNYLKIRFLFYSCWLTSRIKTVLAGELDCPQDNQLSKRARSFELRLV